MKPPESPSPKPKPMTYTPGPTPGTLRGPDGSVEAIPEGWELVSPGDPALTLRAKRAGDHRVVAEWRSRKKYSLGVWAPSGTVEAIRRDLELERSGEAYAKRQVASAARRDRVQEAYVGDFRATVVDFLAFHPDHRALADRLAQLVSDHATPVGSGTVARTKRIPVEQRAEAAVIAWMRHQTTAYDSLSIARIKGERREVRRQLAQRSRDLLDRYRRGLAPARNCPLLRALDRDADPS